MDNNTISSSPPSPSTFGAFKGLTQLGFLDYIEKAWKTHGDFFLLNLGIKSLYFAIHPDVVQQVNVTNSKAYGKVKSYDGVRKYLTGEGLVASTGKLWQQQRKLMAPFFTPKGVQAYADIMIRDSMKIASEWEILSQKNETVDIGEEMMKVTASIILKSMFSSELDKETLEMKEAVEVMIKFTSSQEQGFHLPDWAPTKRNKKYFEAREKVHQYINRIIQQRQAIPKEKWPEDLLTKLMLAKDEETGVSMSENLLRDESITAFLQDMKPQLAP